MKTDKPNSPEERSIPIAPASPRSRSLTQDPLVHIACIVSLILIVYSNTFNAPFQWDEGSFIVNNPIIKNVHYFERPSDAKSLPFYDALINRYVGYLTFAINYKMHGFSVTGFHIVNIAIHIANSILVYLLVLLTFKTPFFAEDRDRAGVASKTDSGQAGMTADSRTSPYISCHSGLSGIDSRTIAFFSAALFAVHPLQTEAVTYVFQRFASLVAFFYLLSLVSYIKARLALTTEHTEEPFNIKKPRNFFWSSQSSAMFSPCSLWLILSFLSAVLAMKTKENAFTLPIIIVLYEFCFFSRLTSRNSQSSSGPSSRFTSRVSRFLYLVPFLLTLLIVPLTLMGLSGRQQPNPVAYGNSVFSRQEYFFTQFRVIVTYLRLLFFPVGQNLDYDYPVFRTFFDPQVMLSFLFLSTLFGFGIYMVIKARDNTKGNDSGQAGMTKEVAVLEALHCHSGLSGIGPRLKFHDSRPLRLMGFGILWFFITLSIESSIIPIPMLINEYRVYLPSVGGIICVVTGAFWVFSPKVDIMYLTCPTLTDVG